MRCIYDYLHNDAFVGLPTHRTGNVVLVARGVERFVGAMTETIIVRGKGFTDGR
jgi:hypothetical protein